MTDEELSAKFQDCTHAFLPPTENEKVLGIIHHLESLGNISELMKTITYPTT
jgi:hypothetical protein